MSEHDNYGIEFLKATTRIKAVCPGNPVYICISICFTLIYVLLINLCKMIPKILHVKNKLL